MYLLIKNSIYEHGVFWVGESLTKGTEMANYAANRDSDDYHDWDLCIANDITEDTDFTMDANYKITYTGVRK